MALELDVSRRAAALKTFCFMLGWPEGRVLFPESRYFSGWAGENKRAAAWRRPRECARFRNKRIPLGGFEEGFSSVGRRQRGRPGRQSQALENPGCRFRRMNRGDNAEFAAALTANQNIHRPNSFHQFRPRGVA
jgi:hypothetical protein